MYSKLSFRNMKRSVSDYAIYFITLMLAVCLFYTFNSISSQQILLELSDVQNTLMGYLDELITLASVIVSVIFCVLCLFANQFLIKRRKKEFGLYMSLGMGKLGVSKILIMETFLIGIVSLIIGIGVGVIVSQGMSVFTASLFNVPLAGYKFIFSTAAAVKTALFFGLVFILVMIFNVIAVSKYTLIELLKSSQKGEVQKIKNPIINGLFTIISLVLVIGGYIVLLNTNISSGMVESIVGFSLLAIGTILFYFSAITFFISMLRKNKKLCYKGINLFNLRQMSAKINSAMVTLATISFLLFFTISILTSGMSYKKTMENELALVAPFDTSLTIYNYDGIKEFDVNRMLDEIGVDLNNHEYNVFNLYDTDVSIQEILQPYAVGQIKRNLNDGAYIMPNAIKYSDYLELMKLQGKEPIKIGANETLIITNMNEAQQTIKNMTNNLTEYEIAGQTLKLVEEKYQLAAIETENTGRMLACFVVNDSLAEKLSSSKTIINLQYKTENPILNQQYEKRFEEMLGASVLSDQRFYARGITKTYAFDEMTGYTTNLLYVGIYLGIVFLITSGAVLGLRMLSDANDEQERYKIIRRIGATEKMINRSILIQVLSYFVAPLILAIPNAIVIGTFITKQLASTGADMSIVPALFTGFILLLLYGGYFLITFSGYKKIVNK